MGNIVYIIIFILIVALGISIYKIYTLKSGAVGVEPEDDYEDLKRKYSDLEARYNELRAAATKVNNLHKDIRNGVPRFSSKDSLINRVNQLKEFWLGYYGAGEQFFKINSDGDADSVESEEFFRDVMRKLKAAELITQLQNNVTQPFIDRMDSDKALEPITARTLLIKMGLQLFDAVSSFQSPNKRKGQEINVAITKQEIAEREALEMAQTISEYETDSPLFIRNIASGLTNIGVEDKGIIIAGYKFSGEKNNTEDVETEEKTI